MGFRHKCPNCKYYQKSKNYRKQECSWCEAWEEFKPLQRRYFPYRMRNLRKALIMLHKPYVTLSGSNDRVKYKLFSVKPDIEGENLVRFHNFNMARVAYRYYRINKKVGGNGAKIRFLRKKNRPYSN